VPNATRESERRGRPGEALGSGGAATSNIYLFIYYVTCKINDLLPRFDSFIIYTPLHRCIKILLGTI